jgi:uncharacterized membrane protein YqjE
MARSATPTTLGNPSEPSIGDLVAQAIKDITQLIKCEIDLAKLELRADARRIGLAAALSGIAAFAGVFILVMASFAYAYGLIAAGVWAWLAFIYVALTWLLLAVIAGVIVYVKVRGVTGLRRTRASVQEDLAVLKRDEQAPAPPAIEAG